MYVLLMKFHRLTQSTQKSKIWDFTIARNKTQMQLSVPQVSNDHGLVLKTSEHLTTVWKKLQLAKKDDEK